MEFYEWVFCFSSFKEVSVKEVINNVNIKRVDLMIGCNGFFFFRMKKLGNL